MKLITWNVNGLRAVHRKGELQKLLTIHQPQLLLLQEIKGTPEQFPPFLQAPSPYQAFYHPAEQAGYSGTGLWLKKEKTLTESDETEPLSLREMVFHRGFSDQFPDPEGRICRLDFNWRHRQWSVFSCYFPNGGKSPAAWEEKLVFYEQFLREVNRLRAQGRSCLWGGDVNCAHHPQDLARPKENDGMIGFHPKERAWLSRVVEAGWDDVFRKTYPHQTAVYSWWHLQSRARSRNIGWRIDYFFLDRACYQQVKKIAYLSQQQGSDHCPLLLELH